MKNHRSDDSCCSPAPVVNNEIPKPRPGENDSVFFVSGMDCADEIAAIQKALKDPRISRVTANLMTSQVNVQHRPDVSQEEITALINSSGVKVLKKSSTRSFWLENRTRISLVSLSGLFLIIGLGCQWFFDLATAWQFTIFLVSTLAGGSLIFPKALRALKSWTLDMNVLMTMAAVGAFAINEYSEAAAVVFLFSLAELLEAFSVARARRAIREVLSITPQLANVVDNEGNMESLPVETILVGQQILVRAGDRIPLDAVVVAGTSYVNQAPLTGESQPVSKTIGDTILAGTLNDSGSLTATVTRGFKDTKIANVIRLVEEAQNQKAPAQLFVDKFARIYTPIVTVVAILVFLLPPLILSQSWDLWLYRSLVFLVIACPCALVIATPVSVVSALTALAKNGVLVKGGVYLESLGRLKAIALDKTGTITEGQPRVISEKVWDPTKEAEFRLVSLSLEKESTHPLAKAVVKYLQEKNVSDSPVVNHRLIPGKGIEGSIGDHHYFAGNHKLAHELGVCSPQIEKYLQSLEDQAQSVMIIGHRPHSECPGEVMGIIGLADKPREGVKIAIRNLHAAGIQLVQILSGDNQRTVDSIAKIVGIDSAIGDQLPEDKVRHIKALSEKYQFVGMVGDGVNDAPALALASVGIAMGAAGTDAAIETADIALMSDDLGQLAKAIQHGRKAIGIIRFNIAFALAIKAIFIGLGIFGLSNLWLAVAADMGASLLVIANSLRLLRIPDTL